MLNNTIGAAYWMVYHLFSDPALLATCRAELERGVTVGEQGEKVVDLGWVKFECPVLVATLQEVMRHRGIGALMIRKVLEDHWLGGRVLLRKGAVLLMPNSVQHFDPAVWGPDANAFDYRRFLKGGVPGRKRVNPGAFRIYGSGATMCLGRHFANTEILSFAALLILQFDVRPVGGARWVEPKTDRSFGLGVAKVFMEPERDCEVEVVARDDPAQQWRVLLTESKRAIHTMSDDIEAHEKMQAEQEKAAVRRESV
jgi:cytochrome P450